MRPVVEFITLMPFVVPAIVLVFGLIRVYSGGFLPLTNTRLGTDVLLVAAYVILALPYMYRAVDTGLAAIDVRTLTEAAQSLGASWPTIMLRVIMPNLRAALLSGAFLTLAFVIGEFIIASFLVGINAFGPYMSQVGQNKTYEHLPDFGKRYPHQLSGGQQQRVVLALALARAIHPQVLLLDEPLSALDAKIRVELRAEIRRIQRQLGITTIYVTHDQEEALSLSDRVVVMSAGHVEQIGTPFEIYNFPATAFTASFIGQLNLVPAVIVDPAAGIVTVNGKTVRLTPPLTAPAGAGVHIALRPEVLSLRDPRAGQPDDLNTLQGQIETVDFLGAVVRVRVAVAESGNSGQDGQTVSVAIDLFNERLLSIPRLGEPVEIVFPPHAGWLIENAGKDR